MGGEHIEFPSPKESIDLSVAIPFYNEEPNVLPVLRDHLATLRGQGIRFELLAVNNGSQDDTGRLIEAMHAEDARVIPLRVAKNRGYGFGILTGLREARGRVVGYTWGDGQIPAADLLRIYRALHDENALLAKACRVKRYDGLYRLIQTRCYSFCFALLFGRGFRDPNGCPKLMQRELFEEIDPQSHNWLLDPEIMIKARRMGSKVVDIPVIFLKRKEGRSKVNLLTTVGFFAGLLRMRLRSRF